MIAFLYGLSKYIYYFLIDLLLIYLIVSICKDMIKDKKEDSSSKDVDNG